MALSPNIMGGGGQSQVVPPNQAMAIQAQPLIGNQVTPGGLQGNIGQVAAGSMPANTSSGVSSQSIGSIAPRASASPVSGNNPNAMANQSNFGPVDTGVGAFQGYTDSAYDAAMRQMQPQIDAQRDQIAQSLVGKGLQPGTVAYNNEMDRMTRGHNDMTQSAAYGAQQAGLAAQNQYFGQEMQNNQFGMAQNDQNYQHQFGYDQLDNQTGIAKIGAAASTAAAGASAGAARYNAQLRNNFNMAQLEQSQNQFDVNDIFRTNQQDIDAGLSYGQLGLAQDQFGLRTWESQNNANNDYFNQIGGLFQNAPGFTGFSGSSGLGANAVAAGDAQAQADAAQMAAIGSMVGGAAAFSSVDYKDIGSDVDKDKVLESVNDMDITEWTYNDNAPVSDREKHIGTTAEQFNEKLGLSSKDHINLVDAVGSLMSCIQALTKRLEKLEQPNG